MCYDVNSIRSSELSRARYEGDISSWGRKKDPGFYNSRRGDGRSESDYTMSSGLSPRDSVIHKPFDVQEAKNVSMLTTELSFNLSPLGAS